MCVLLFFRTVRVETLRHKLLALIKTHPKSTSVINLFILFGRFCVGRSRRPDLGLPNFLHKHNICVYLPRSSGGPAFLFRSNWLKVRAQKHLYTSAYSFSHERKHVIMYYLRQHLFCWFPVLSSRYGEDMVKSQSGWWCGSTRDNIPHTLHHGEPPTCLFTCEIYDYILHIVLFAFFSDWVRWGTPHIAYVSFQRGDIAMLPASCHANVWKHCYFCLNLTAEIEIKKKKSKSFWK